MMNTTDDRTGPRNDSGATSRRGFLGIGLGAGLTAMAASVLYPIMRFVMPPKVRESATTQAVAARVDELSPDTGKIFRFGKDPAILVRMKNGEYRSFSAICTHLDCTVQYRSDLGEIWCACHNGHYNLRGQVVSGPPPAGLTEYTVVVRGDQIVVSKA